MTVKKCDCNYFESDLTIRGKVSITQNGEFADRQKLNVEGGLRLEIAQGLEFLGDTDYLGSDEDTRILQLRAKEDGEKVRGGLVIGSYNSEQDRKPLMVLRQDGWVGIGTKDKDKVEAIAGTSLNVAGDIQAAGALSVKGETNLQSKLTVTGGLTVIGNLEIKNGTLSGTNLVSTQQITNNSVTTEKLADLSVSTAKLQNGSITKDKLAISPELYISATETSSASLNLKNKNGFWHISGPRSYESNNNLSIYWNNNVQYNGPFLTIQDNGNVGIGTTAPGAKLHVISTSQDANGNTLILGSTDASNLRLGYHADYSWIQSHGSKPIAINPLGNNVGIGTTSPGKKLHVVGDIYVEGNVIATGKYWSKSYDGVWQTIKHASSPGVWIWEKNNPFSDLNLKKDIVPINHAIAVLEQLQPVSFYWADSNYFRKEIDKDLLHSSVQNEQDIEAVNQVKEKIIAKLEKQQFGFIAQDVERVFPDWVETSEDGYKTLNMAQINSLLVQGIKELKMAHDKSEAEKDELKRRLEILESKTN